MSAADFRERLNALVRAIPAGRVSTYGALARALGRGVSPRAVGFALAASADGVPTHRVVSAQGEPRCRRGQGGPTSQRDLLEQEGVPFDERGRVRLSEVFWRPVSAEPKEDQ